MTAAYGTGAGWLQRLFTACLAAAGGALLWPRAMHGEDLSAVGALVLWWIAGTQLFSSWEQYDIAVSIKKVRRRATRRNEHLPSSKFATTKELKAAGMLDSTGTFIGVDPPSGKEISCNFVNELVIAGPGAGKTTSKAAQILLRDTRESAFVVDVKKELFYTSAEARRRMGHDVYCISAFADDYNRQYPHAEQVVDAGFNPFAFITDHNAVDDIRMVCQLVVPEPDGGRSDNDFFVSQARDLLTGLALLLRTRGETITLSGIRDLLLAAPQEFESAVAEMMDSDAFDGELARFGNQIGGTYTKAPKQWTAISTTAADALQPFYTGGPLQVSTSKPGFDFGLMKSGKKPVTVYFCVPPERIQSLRGYIALVISLAVELISRDKSHRKVHLIIDELQNISKMPTLLKGLALYRGANIRTTMLVQFLSALERLYGPSHREFFGADVITLFGATGDTRTLEIFSQLVGDTRFDEHTVSSDPASVTDTNTGFTTNTSQGKRPLLSIAELRMLGDKEQISLIRNLPPVKSHRQSYLENLKLRARARHNPLYPRPRLLKRLWRRL